MKFCLIVTDEESWLPFNKEHEEWMKNLPGAKLLAERGITFQNHHTAASACPPARASLYTGKLPSPGVGDQDPIFHNLLSVNGFAKDSFESLSPLSPNLGSILSSHGYKCCYTGKWHLTPNPSEEEIHSFGWKETRWFDSEKEPHGMDISLSGTIVDPETQEKSLQFLEKCKRENYSKVCLAVNYVQPHDINLYLRLKFNSLLPSDLPTLSDYSSSADEDPRSTYEELWYQYQQKHLYGPEEFMNLFDLIEYRRYYLWCCLQVDRMIFQLLLSLDSSWTIFRTADHGSLYGTQGGIVGKWFTASDYVTRIPFTLCLPEKKHAGSNYTFLSSSIDLLPTLLDLARIENCYFGLGIPLLKKKREFIDFLTFDNPTIGNNQSRLYDRILSEEQYKYSSIPFFGLWARKYTDGRKKIQFIDMHKYFHSRL